MYFLNWRKKYEVLLYKFAFFIKCTQSDFSITLSLQVSTSDNQNIKVSSFENNANLCKIDCESKTRLSGNDVITSLLHEIK